MFNFCFNRQVVDCQLHLHLDSKRVKVFTIKKLTICNGLFLLCSNKQYY